MKLILTSNQVEKLLKVVDLQYNWLLNYYHKSNVSYANLIEKNYKKLIYNIEYVWYEEWDTIKIDNKLDSMIEAYCELYDLTESNNKIGYPI